MLIDPSPLHNMLGVLVNTKELLLYALKVEGTHFHYAPAILSLSLSHSAHYLLGIDISAAEQSWNEMMGIWDTTHEHKPSPKCSDARRWFTAYGSPLSLSLFCSLSLSLSLALSLSLSALSLSLALLSLLRALSLSPSVVPRFALSLSLSLSVSLSLSLSLSSLHVVHVCLYISFRIRIVRCLRYFYANRFYSLSHTLTLFCIFFYCYPT